ncbi:SLAP domain-containing protein [uncultured Lactobacillus sp.]|uniref:SLAP domain-containing protein n=1 Tax=uncultured Lactobacillus sp. TaxID=153152 RepID=UPI0025E0065E|nr:SLAP domain-containing protein [uncultured Lactobacillus sp.]
MKKKLLLSLTGITALVLGLSVSKPVVAATSSIQGQNPSTTKETNTANQSDSNKEQTSSNDTSAAGSSFKNTNNLSKVLKYLQKSVILKKPAYIYDNKGKKIKNKKLKKGTIVYVSGLNTAKRRSFLQISTKGKKKQYIKPGNVKILKIKVYKVKTNAKVYDKKGRLVVKGNKYAFVKKGVKIPVYYLKKINGQKFAGISKTQFLRWSDLVH